MSPWESRQPAVDVNQVELGWILCPTCGIRFAMVNRNEWSGHRHLRCGQRLRVVDATVRQPEPIWCVVGNIAGTGTRAFKPGSRVYCFPPLWGDGWEYVKVIGKHIKTGKFAAVVVKRASVNRLRVIRLEQPNLLDRPCGPWDGTPESQQRALELVKGLSGFA